MAKRKSSRALPRVQGGHLSSERDLEFLSSLVSLCEEIGFLQLFEKTKDISKREESPPSEIKSDGWDDFPTPDKEDLVLLDLVERLLGLGESNDTRRLYRRLTLAGINDCRRLREDLGKIGMDKTGLEETCSSMASPAAGDQ